MTVTERGSNANVVTPIPSTYSRLFLLFTTLVFTESNRDLDQDEYGQNQNQT